MPLVFLLYALFSIVFIICKAGLLYSTPLFFVGSRMAVAGVVLVLYHLYVHGNKFALTRAILFRIICLGFFNIYLTNACEVWGLKYLSSAKTCFVYSLCPFVSALLSLLLFSEKMSKKKWCGLIIGFLGFLPIILGDSSASDLGGAFGISLPELSVATAAFASVYGWILLKQLIADYDVTPVLANGISMLFGGLMALFHSFFVENWNPVPVTEVIPFLECTLLLLVISNLTCYNLYGYLLKKYSATFMAFAGFTTPLFTALFGWIFFGETVSAYFYLSMLIVFCGLAIFKQEEISSGESVRLAKSL